MVEGYSTDLYRYAAWLCGDRALAEDLVQETFARAWRSLNSLQHNDAVKPWLFTLLRREYVRHCEYPRPMSERLNANGAGDVGRYEINAELAVLRRALAGLAPEYREPLILQVIGGFSCEEIGQFLSISPTAAMTRVFRARKQLRDTVSDERLRRSNKVMA
ncbi:MAG TPA: sigma-70 family RNA polymerase sigma factor [Gammaproteobacteria bacterium]|nr:sigma-70 family RNA polymerase sigma factor [Gammaproteobacteria bacterium]